MNHPGNFIDRTGIKHGRLSPVKYLPDPGSNKAGSWECLCDCGKTVTIRSGNFPKVSSCGCLRSDVTKQRMTTHGLSKTPTYQIWAAMKRRCNLPTDSAFYKYGARGIRLCDRWESFENFIEDMGERPSRDHSIERIDNAGNYEPGNCRWATRLEQANNKRNNVFLTINGETHTVPEWARISGVRYHTIRKRLEKGIDPRAAVFTAASPLKKF